MTTPALLMFSKMSPVPEESWTLELEVSPWLRRGHQFACPSCGAGWALDAPRAPGYRFSCPECGAWLTWRSVGLETVRVPACPVCGAEAVERSGKYGRFWACPGYPSCKGKVGGHTALVEYEVCEIALWEAPTLPPVLDEERRALWERQEHRRFDTSRRW